MWRLTLVALVLVGLAGCVTPHTTLGTIPAPVLSTRPQQPLPTPPPAVRPVPEYRPVQPRRMPAATIVIDPGHGGRDPGAPGVGSMVEKTVNLNVASRLGRLLDEKGARVIATRSSDVYPTLDERAALADRSRADLFISIHADSAKRSSASGATVYVARNATKQSLQAAQAIVAAMEHAGIECRGVRRAGYRVLVGHSRPAVLIECGYLSNRREARLLSTTSYQAKLASAIAEGVVDHFTR